MGPKATQGPEPGFFVAKNLLIPWVGPFHRWHIEGLEHIPSEGPAIVASNHVSLFDPLAVAYAILQANRRPRFFAKSSLFEAPLVGQVLASARQIRVDRGTASAPASLEHAEEASAQGELIVIFPEGTTTKAPDLTPLVPKTGVARLALNRGLSVIPCATWGGQWVWSYHMGFRPRWKPDIWVRFGEPISFKRYSGRESDPEVWAEVTRELMDTIWTMGAEFRAAKPWTPRPLKKRAQRKLAKRGKI